MDFSVKNSVATKKHHEIPYEAIEIQVSIFQF